MSPNKCSGMRSPLQEENSVAHHEVKCQGKPLAGIYRKRDGKPLKWPCSDHSWPARILQNNVNVLNFYPAFSSQSSRGLNHVWSCCWETQTRGKELPVPGRVPCWSDRFSLLSQELACPSGLIILPSCNNVAPGQLLERLTGAKSTEIMSLGCPDQALALPLSRVNLRN